MVQETARRLARDTRVRRLVQARQDRVLKVARCLCTDVFRREASTIGNTKEIVAINLEVLERFEDGATVSVDTLIETGIVKNPRDGVKILGRGELTKKLNVQVNAFSASAKEKIEALGGTAEVI